MSYVLTVLNNGTLEHVGVFAGFERARAAALAWAQTLTKVEFIDTTPPTESSKSVTYWRFVETNKVSIVVRFMINAEQSSFERDLPPAYLKVKASFQPAVAPAPIFSSREKDDPLALHLPAGWSYPDRKPLTVADIKDGKNFLLTYELTETEKFALVTARVSKRPNCLFYLPPEGKGLYSQKYALQELKTKTQVGNIIVEKDLQSLAALYQTVSTEFEDEESSSDESDFF